MKVPKDLTSESRLLISSLEGEHLDVHVVMTKWYSLYDFSSTQDSSLNQWCKQQIMSSSSAERVSTSDWRLFIQSVQRSQRPPPLATRLPESWAYLGPSVSPFTGEEHRDGLVKCPRNAGDRAITSSRLRSRPEAWQLRRTAFPRVLDVPLHARTRYEVWEAAQSLRYMRYEQCEFCQHDIIADFFWNKKSKITTLLLDKEMIRICRVSRKVSSLR